MQVSFLSQPSAVAVNSITTRANPSGKKIFAEILSETQGHNYPSKSAQYSTVATEGISKQSAMLDTNKGKVSLDLDNYYSNDPPVKSHFGRFSLDDLPPLLLPSAKNIQALSNHASAKFKNMLAEYNIPAAPEKITYDNQGEMQIPADYPYAKQLKQALEENPGLDRELRDLNAITSHYVMIQERLPFSEEMSHANSQAEIDWIIRKYSHLLHDNHSYKSISLMFSGDGNLSITADGKPVQIV